MHAPRPDTHGPHAPPTPITAARQRRPQADQAPLSAGTTDRATTDPRIAGPSQAAGAGPVLALDLGGTQIRSAVVLPDGSLRARQNERTPLADGADAVLAACVASLRRSLEKHLLAGGAPPVALGISAPGPLDPRSGVLIDPPNLGSDLWGLPLGPRLSEALGLPVSMERDTHVAILAERAFGAGAGLDDLVYLTISTGIGGAVITGGRLMTGPDGVAGELGHLTVDMDGPVCSCGARGHLERLTSGSGMALSAREALAAGADAPELARIAAQIHPRPLEASHVSAAAAAGDPVARQIIERARRAFAASVVSIVDVFDPARIIVGGGVAEAWGEALLQPARELVAQTAFRVAAQRAEIVAARLGADVGLIGALPLVSSTRAAGLPGHHAELIPASAVPAAAG